MIFFLLLSSFFFSFFLRKCFLQRCLNLVSLICKVRKVLFFLYVFFSSIRVNVQLLKRGNLLIGFSQYFIYFLYFRRSQFYELSFRYLEIHFSNRFLHFFIVLNLISSAEILFSGLIHGHKFF